jgi:anti-sigma regulatory factor (Ser/Thr protein kinase)
MEILKVESQLSELDKIRAFLKKNLKGLEISEENYYIVELSLLEICINIMRYAYPGKKGGIVLRSWLRDETIYLEIMDNGIPFDPTEAQVPDINQMIKTEQKGGFGIFLVKELMDGFDYIRKNDQNILTIFKKINSPPK